MPTILYAEGSRDLIASANGQGHRAFLEYSKFKTGDVQHKGIIKVYVEAGETVRLGSSVTENDDDPTRDILWRSPFGSDDGSCDVKATGEGFIDTLQKEAIGPFPDEGGYTPCEFQAQETGIYEVEFVSRRLNTAVLLFNPPATKVDQPFLANSTQGKTVAAWDVTVLKENEEQIGRAYANYLPLHMGDGGTYLYAQTYIQNNRGYLYHTNLNGIDAWQFLFFSNNKGFKDATGQPILSSVEVEAKGGKLKRFLLEGEEVFLHNPADPDQGTDATHKIFFNRPSDILPKDDPQPIPGGGTTWLLMTQPTPPQVSDFAFTGIEGTPNQAGTTPEPLGGHFSFKTDSTGIYLLTIDVNNDEIFGNDKDRVLIGQATIGDNQIFWDGLDGDGAGIPPQELGYGANLSLIVDDIHFPMTDPEFNPNGLIVTRENCDLDADLCRLLYFNNQKIIQTDPFTGESLAGSPDPISATAGMDSINGAQKFDEGDYPGGFGDNRGIDVWTSIAVPQRLKGGIQIKKSDLSIDKSHTPDQPSPGDSVTYTVTVRNGGPSGAVGIKVQDTLPVEITNVSWQCAVTPVETGNQCATGSGTGSINGILVNLKSGAAATFTIQGTLASNLTEGQIVSNTATVTRPPDTTNPDPTGDGDDPTESVTNDLTVGEAPDIPNKPPVAQDKTTPSTPNTTPVKIPALSATDPDGIVESYTVATLPPGTSGVLYLNDPSNAGATPITLGQVLTPGQVNSLFFKPNPDFTGNTTFTYIAIDDKGLSSNIATVTIPVTEPGPGNQPPVADDMQRSTEIDTAVTIPLLGNNVSDPDGNLDASTLKIITPANHGQAQLDPNTGEVTYTPDAGFTGTDTFQYEICDTFGLCDTATVTINIPSASPTVTTLKVSIIGQGEVDSTPSGIYCVFDNDEQCANTGEVDRLISLTPTPAPGWRFEGWNGCDASEALLMDTNKVCQAVFVQEDKQRVDLTVEVPPETTTGKIPGNVTSQPSGINCGTQGDTCEKDYAVDTGIELNAKPESGFRFKQWEGDCTGVNNTIVISMDTAKNCRALFEPLPTNNYPLTITKTGDGKVTSDIGDIDCGTVSCMDDYPADTIVKLTATPEPGSQFIQWSGDCSGTAAIVSVTLKAAKHCHALFEPLPANNYPLTITKTGDGKVTSDIGDIDCGTVNCMDDYPANTVVKLTATPESGSQFIQWDGDCSGTAAIVSVTLETAKHCHAVFEPLPDAIDYPLTTLIKTGSGTVSGNGIACPADCAQDYPSGTLVELVATPETGFKFTGWGGDCDGATGSITVTIDQAKYCEANFEPLNPGQIEWSSDNFVADEFGEVATVTVSRISGIDGRVTVDYSTHSGSATQGVDYEPVSGTLVWEDGDSSDKTITIPLKKGDAAAESNETVNLLLSNPTGGATLLTPDPVALIITDTQSSADTGGTTNGTTTTACNALSSCQSLASSCCLSCQVGCLTCQPSGVLKVKALSATLRVGQTLNMTLTEGLGTLSIREIPHGAFVALDSWQPLGTGTAQVTLTGLRVGETAMVVGDDADPWVRIRINITVIDDQATSVSGDQTLTTTLQVRQTLHMTVAGGQGKLAIEEMPNNAFVSLDSWLPLGDSGVGEIGLTGLKVGETRLVIRDRGRSPQKTTIVIKVVSSSSTVGDDVLIGDTGDTACEANALGVDALGQSVHTSACFGHRILLPQGATRPNGSMFTPVESQALALSTLVNIDPQHVGEVANVLLVRVHTTLTDETRETRDGPQWQLWDDQIASLPVAQHVPELYDGLEIPVQAGDFSQLAGELTFFSGYQLLDGTVIYDGLNPLHIFVGNAASFNLRDETPKHPTSNEVHATTFFEPLVYNAQGKKGNRLTFNTADQLHVSSFVRADNWHVGRPADILIVATRRDALDQATYYYHEGKWHQWFDDLAQLQPAAHYHQLPATFEVPVDLGTLLGEPATFIIFLGYRLDGYIIIFNGLEPIELSIVD